MGRVNRISMGISKCKRCGITCRAEHFRYGKRLLPLLTACLLLATAARPQSLPALPTASEGGDAAVADVPAPLGSESVEVEGGSGDADDNVTAAAPASLADWMRSHMAAVVWREVQTSKSDAAETGDDDGSGTGVGVAIRLTPDRWLPWLAGPFLNDKEIGPFVGYRLFAGKGGSAGVGGGYRWRMDDKIKVRDRGALVVGMTLSLAAARGGE